MTIEGPTISQTANGKNRNNQVTYQKKEKEKGK